MSTTTRPQALRPLAPIELFSSTRQHLGIYRCVTITCRHQLPNSLPLSTTSHPIFPALARVVSFHPMLRVGILGQDTNTATFSHIPQIDLRKHVEFRNVPGGEGYEDGIAEIQGWCDDQLWQDVETRPPWRVIVVTPGGSEEGFEDIVFAFHHSLMDGTSGKAFHEHLLEAFNALPSQPPSEPTYILSFPTAPILPESQDDVIPFRNSYAFLLQTLWSEFGPWLLKPAKAIIWGGELIDYTHPHHTRVKPVDIPAGVVGSLIKECRAHNSSVTGLLHALCLASFAKRVDIPKGVGLDSSTPIALRPYMSPTANPETKDTLRVLISSMSHAHPPSTITAFRAPSADINNLIWQTAQRIKNDLRNRTAALPADDIVSMTKYITNWFEHWKNHDGTARATTWEVSNIGAVDMAAGESERRITRVLFTNGAMIAGPAVGVSVASVKGGVLTCGISWNEGVVSDELIEGLAEDLANFTRTLHETGEFTV
ncbi:Fc.00g071850.m01.CDS01 [Cosmosporella sp. VM-42]